MTQRTDHKTPTGTLETALDERDRNILAERLSALDNVGGQRVGDFVRFADGTLRRISYLWDNAAQTSDGGSYYLGDGHVSMSGSLYPHVPFATLTLTDERRGGSVWFFHHDIWGAGRGVNATIPFRVYICALDAGR